MFELANTDGAFATVPAEKKTPASAEDVAQLRRDVGEVLAAVLAQQAEIAKLNRAIASMRVSRTQELALSDAIRRRAREICAGDALASGCSRRVAAAIRTTLREITGARSVGDIQAGQFDAAMEQITRWHMSGVIRRIRRDWEAEYEKDGR